jgi:Domain of unknown function (DUF4268)
MDAQELGTLKPISLQHVWPKEAGHFTPWLADHLAALGEKLGIDLELQAREAPVGDFSLDILARDLGRNRPVIIENQLKPTDHDHLGKLLTYAAGNDAGVVVWVAQEIREEHRQALDWLNQHTDESVDFFGVVVEVVQIDESRPAYNFRLVAFPNEWRKRNVSRVPSATSKGEAYRAFFQALIDRLREQHKFTGARVAQPANWTSFASGVSGFVYGANFPQGDKVRVELYLDRGDAALNKRVFDALAADKAAIQSQFNEALSWERMDANQASRIAVYRSGSIEDPAETLEDTRQWMIERLRQMKKVFGPRLSQLAR